jgi:hypothetical protein
VSYKPTARGRTANLGERQRAAANAYEAVYGVMAKETPSEWPEWMLDPGKLPKRPPSPSRSDP